ncbi:MAG: single-stranded-DNA-specific exonuclease RecJ [Deltaproteobacteria bacterium]|nr:single-stranded-DNA-specific exonuclease RecJ [Deltaproteobacteria bacterium]
MADAWQLRTADEDKARALAAALGTRGLTARILVARGFVTAESAGRFLSPRLGDLRPPVGIADLDRAVERIVGAVARGEKVGVFADYDVDGITSAAILALLLRSLGMEVVTRMAKRASGYGFSPDDATTLVERGCGLILTGDCGTTDQESLASCRSRGVDVIVIDHHHVPSGVTQAYALLNSHRQDDTFAFKGLASCGVAFYLAAAVRTRLRAEGDSRADAIDPRTWLDLVALGTVADLVPLTHENRILVAAGLSELSALRRPGLAALAELAGLPPGGLGTTQVSFRLAPRLNAAGRLGDAQLALELLLADDLARARELAGALEELNRERQRIQERVWAEALAAAETQADAPALVLGAPGWHQGVVGIVAAKLVDRYGKPTVVVGFADGRGRGSARTTGGFDLCEGLERCRAHLAGFGGHPMAAGVTVDEAQFPDFRTAFLAAAAQHFANGPGASPMAVDAVASLADLDVTLAEELARLGPFGTDNGEPLLGLPRVRVRSTRVVGASHLQLTLAHEEAVSEAIAFGMADRDPGSGACLDVIVTPEVDDFRGRRKIRLRLRHFTRSLGRQ